MHLPAVSREGGSVLGGAGRGGGAGERRIEPEPVEEERSGEAGDGRGRPTADALNLTDGEG